MAIHKYGTMSEAVDDLRKRGFNKSFLFEDEELKCIQSGKIFNPEELRILEFHRFEGPSDPGDMSIIFAIICNDGGKGTIVSSYGIYADMDLVAFLDKVKIIRPEEYAS